MLIFQTEQMTIKTKYLVNNNGTWMYQRRIPLGLRKFFQDKQHIRIKVTGHLTSMAAEIARHARDTDTLFAQLRGSCQSDHAQAEAESLLASYGLRPGSGNWRAQVPVGMYDQPHLADIDEYLWHKAENGTLTEADKLAEMLLTKPMPLMLSKSLEVYFANHQKGTIAKFRADTLKHFKHIFEVLGDVAVVNLTRESAKKYVVARSGRVSTNSVAREISTIKAVLNTVIRENELGINNPFLSITIPDLGKDARVREPYTLDEIRLIIQACLGELTDSKVILLLCALTGARLSEITGLRRQDIYLEADIPNVEIVEYNQRTLKTKNSRRSVPLVGLGVEVLAKHLSSHHHDVAFPRYNDGNEVNGTNASSTIVGFIKRLGIQDKTVHHTRHTMRDLLRHADVPPHIIDAIGGWGSNSVGESYGRGYSLNQKLDALKKALEPVLYS